MAVGPLPDETVICHCHNVPAGTLRSAVRSGCTDPTALRHRTRAGSGCGSCAETVATLLDEGLPTPGSGGVPGGGESPGSGEVLDGRESPGSGNRPCANTVHR
ncbi:(2Fe-2S)-binding protein [Streptomyces sp. SP18BB07]|uniref:(2Fe-2S)-binding protein n=1 Tax=Streptomyces sp. SP18BB07 TaxID=3002522 RepID=UPI002E762ECB|nr:(2Fe-2S)-binding protein [Streptomyces sp. SP18BB07]MEE1760980.1 (2Fe-2S)-binding protein [Streptomyces sp. SP18BB07]